LTRARLLEDREWVQHFSWQEHQRHMQKKGTNLLPNNLTTISSEILPYAAAPSLLPNISRSTSAAQVIKTSSGTAVAANDTNLQIEFIKEQKELLYLQIKLAQLTAENKCKDRRRAIEMEEDEEKF